MAYRIQLFGKLSVAHADAPLPLPARSDARLLLANLLVYRQRPHSRSTLLGSLWPDLPETRARRALSQALWQVRRLLPGVVQADHDTIQIQPEAPLWVDVTEFEALIEPHLRVVAGDPRAKQDLEKAIQLYQGDLLEGFYADWVLEERRRLREKCYHALEGLAHLEKAAGRYQNALDLALILVTADPLRETAHREVMRLYYFLDRPQAALQQFAICRQILQSELKLEPEYETAALADEIAGRVDRSNIPGEKTGTPYLPAVQLPAQLPISVGEASAIQVALVGRDAERAQLLRHVEAVFGGEGGVVMIEGEAGVGKTRLVTEIARDAEWRSAQVLMGSGNELGIGRPYEPLMEALASGLTPLRAEQLTRLVDPIWLQVLQPMLPALPESPTDFPQRLADPAIESGQLVEALGQLLAGWAQITPLLVVLEDLHWASEGLLELLAQLTPRLRNVGVLVVGTYRGEEVRGQPPLWERLQELDRIGLRIRLKLAGLDLDGTGELIRRALGAGQLASEFPAQVYQETGGNPLFVLETLRTVYSSGLLKRDEGGRWHVSSEKGEYTGLPLSWAVESAIARRLRQLPPTLRQILNAAAILGYYFEPLLLTEVSGLDPRSVMAALRELVQRQLLNETPQDYRFSHDKVRQTTYAELSADERLWLHGRAAQAYEQLQPNRFELLAHHFAKAEMWNMAVYYHRQSGEQARFVHAYSTAVDHFSAAIVLADWAGLSNSDRFDLLAARETVYEVLGNRQAQAADLEVMAHLAQAAPERVVAVNWRRARLLASRGRFDEAETAARQALSFVNSHEYSPALVSAAQITLGKVLLSRGDPDRAFAFLQAAVKESPATADQHVAAIEARNLLALNLLYLGDYPAARAQAESAYAASVKTSDGVGQADVLVSLGEIAFEQGIIEEATTYYQRALDLSRVLGYRQNEAMSLHGLGDVLSWEGRLSEALQSYEQAAAISQAVGQPQLEALARARGADIFLFLADAATATNECRAALACAQETGDRRLQGICFLLLGKIARQRGGPEVARRHFEACLEALDRASEKWAWDKACVYLELAQLALGENDPETALGHIETVEAISRKLHMTGFNPYLLAQRGAALLALDRLGEALAASTQAINQLASAAGQAHLIRLVHFQILTALKRTDEARSAVEQAYQLLMKRVDGFPPDQGRRALERLPEHRTIVTAWEANQPKRVTVRLPRASAPIGRPLREHEWAEINWTVALPEDETNLDKVARRRQRLMRLLREAAAQGAAPTYDHLAQALQASVRTIATDMVALRRSYVDLPSTRRKYRAG